MPIYEYQCKSCDAKFEKLVHGMSTGADGPSPACPECGSARTTRELSVFAVGAQGQGAGAAPPPGMCDRCGGPGPCANG